MARTRSRRSRARARRRMRGPATPWWVYLLAATVAVGAIALVYVALTQAGG